MSTAHPCETTPVSFDRFERLDTAMPASSDFPARYARHLEVEHQLGVALGWTDLKQVGEVWHGGFPPEWFVSFPTMPRGCGCFLPKWTRSSADSFDLMVRFGLYPCESDGVVRVLSTSKNVLASVPLRENAGSVDKSEAMRLVIAEAVLAWLAAGGEVRPE